VELHGEADGVSSACVPAPATPSKIAARACSLHSPDPLSTPGCCPGSKPGQGFTSGRCRATPPTIIQAAKDVIRAIHP
jgi:hypothetical protein